MIFCTPTGKVYIWRNRFSVSMVFSIIVFGVIAAALVAMGIIILAGKGDNLIAGYNTASRAEREKVNLKRLRLLMGITLFVIALLCVLRIFDDSPSSLFGFCAAIIFICIIVLVLANTWAMKKK